MSTTILAFDYGTRRIGIASANMLTGTATPLTTLRVGKSFPWDALDRIIAEWAPDRLVVGQPYASGATDIDARVGQFVQELEKRYKLPVATVDETLTSRVAESTIVGDRRSGLRPKRIKKGDIDRHSACLIAEQWIKEAREHG